MNREQRRKMGKKLIEKAEEIWKLEMLGVLAKDKEVKIQIEREIETLCRDCSFQEMLVIDAYLTDKYGDKG